MNGKHPRITADPAIMLGKPCVAGTRITVEHLLCQLVTLETVDRICADYPSVTAFDIHAAVDYAIDAVNGGGR